MDVDVRTKHVFTASTLRVLVPAKAIGNLKSDGMDNFEVSPDRQRFLIHHQSEGSKTPQIHVVLNWTEDLRRLCTSAQDCTKEPIGAALRPTTPYHPSPS